MKKIVLLGATVIAALSLAACGGKSSNPADSNKTTQSSSSTTAPTQVNKDIAKELETKFNTNGEKNVKVSIETDVVDEQSVTDKNGNAKGHQIIHVEIVNADALKTMKAAKDALDSNTADETQTQAIAGVQTIVADEAKKLANDNDTISCGWSLEDADHTQLIALSTRKENVIAIAGQQ